MRRQQLHQSFLVTTSCMWIFCLYVVVTTTTTAAFSSAPTSVTNRQPTSRFAASTTDSSSVAIPSSFDSYQQGVTKDVVWKDDLSSVMNTGSNGYTAKEQDVCVVSFVGTIMSTGRTFNKNDEFVFQIGSGKSMPGFDTGCIGMAENARRTIRVPPSRAYGMKGTFDGRVPPNSDIEFVITMKRLVSNEQSPLLAQLALFGEFRLIGILGCVAVLALPPFFQ